MKQKVLGFIAAGILLLLRLTWRYKLEFQRQEDREFFLRNYKKLKAEQNFVLAFFHRDELSLIPFFKHTGIGVLVSVSKDGEIMTNLAKLLGYEVVRGSSSRKAVSGLIAAIKHTQKGHKFSMAVDGPKGPIYKVKEGVIAISQKSGAPIVPVIARPNRYHTFTKAWNQARFPLPFNTITLRIGNISFYNAEELESALLTLDKTE